MSVCLFFLIMVIGVPLNSGEIVINEVMSNVKGSDSGIGSPGDRNEFIELYNASDDSIDLSLFSISDLDAVDEIKAWTDTLLIDPDVIFGTTMLPPKSFAVILDPEYTDSGDGNYLQPYDFPQATLIVTIGNTTIGDGLSTRDPVVLIDALEDTISSYGTPSNQTDSIPCDPGDGISAERISPYVPDHEQSWTASIDTSGSTPGGANSYHSLDNLIIPATGFTVEPGRIQLGETVTVRVLVQNLTQDTVNGVTVDFFCDCNWDSMCQGEERIAQSYSPDPIPPFGCSLDIAIEWQPDSEGNKRMSAKFADDEKAGVFRMLAVGNPVGEIVINEIMFHPEKGGEWIELYNRSPFPIDISGWTLRVGSDEVTLTSSHMVIESEEYLVIAEDKSLFHTVWGNIPSELMEPDKWVQLANSGDSIALNNKMLFCFDEVVYSMQSEPGVSLERINPAVASEQTWNWGSSCDYRGGTPGAKNSIYTASSEERTILTVSPNPFSPNGDGFEERTLIAYELPFYEARINLFLYTRTGVRKRCFLQQEDSGKSGHLLWDGRDSDGKMMPIGLYIIFLEAVDKASNKRILQKKAVAIAGRR